MAVNTKLANINIAHQHNIESYKTGVYATLLKLFKGVEDEIKASILTYDMPRWSKVKQEDLLNRLEKIRTTGVSNINKQLIKEMEALHGTEIEFYVKQINAVLESVKVKTIKAETPDTEKAWKKTRSGKISFEDGQVASVTAFISTFTDRNQLYLKQALEKGYRKKLSMVELSTLLFGIGGYMTRSEAQLGGMSSTALQYASAEGRAIAYAGNSDIISGFEWISVLDSHTTDFCRGRSGGVHYYGHPELSTIDDLQPPVHYRCRSITAPIVKSAEELGLAPIVGLTGVAAGIISYNTWFNNSPEKVQKDAIGPVRYALWKSGEIDIEAFYTSDGRQLTLDQLVQKGITIPEEYLRYI